MNTTEQENTVSNKRFNSDGEGGEGISQNSQTAPHARADATPERVVRRRAAVTTITKMDLTSINQEISEGFAIKHSPAEIVDDLDWIIYNADMAGRDGGREIDFKTRLTAQQARLAYLAGRPVERQQIVTANIISEETEEALAKRIAESPALRKTLKKLLDD